MNYDWDYKGFGGTLTRLSDNYSCWLQGDEAAEFDSDWENCIDDEQCDILASAYDDVMDYDGEEPAVLFARY